MSSPSETSAAPTQHDIRRYAMQVLYQFDLRGDDDRDAIRDDVCADTGSPALGERAFQLATDAWATYADCDAMTTQLAPDWPAHRQPPLDRALLRLAYHEITTGRTPAKVAISEAVNLAKEFCAERSPSFINGVLDKLVKRIDLPAVKDAAPLTTNTTPNHDDAWLADAVNDSSDESKDATDAAT